MASLFMAPLVGTTILLLHIAEGPWGWWITPAYLWGLIFTGGWSALLGALGTRTLDALARRQASAPTLLLTGFLGGASVGLAFVGWLVGLDEGVSWLLTGSLAGAASGLLCARLVIDPRPNGPHAASMFPEPAAPPGV